MEKRQPKVVVACGQQGSGKSIETIDTIFRYVKGNPQLGIPPRKALIFDANNEFGSFKWKDGRQIGIPRIYMRDIIKMRNDSGVWRVAPVWDDNKKMSINDMGLALSMILEHYRSGLLLVEDINKYISDTPTKDFIGALATCRHLGIDLYTHFQLVGKAGNPKILGMASYIRLHKTRDEVKKHENKFLDKTRILTIAETIVNNRFQIGMRGKTPEEKKNQFFFVWIDVSMGKITGEFTREEAENAISEYLSDNYTQVLAPVLNKRDRKGQLVYKNYEEAYSTLEQRYLDEFFFPEKLS